MAELVQVQCLLCGKLFDVEEGSRSDVEPYCGQCVFDNLVAADCGHHVGKLPCIVCTELGR